MDAVPSSSAKFLLLSPLILGVFLLIPTQSAVFIETLNIIFGTGNLCNDFPILRKHPYECSMPSR